MLEQTLNSLQSGAEIVYGLLTIGTATNTIHVLRYANLCQFAPNVSQQDCQRNDVSA
jgi:hypothetical protein